MQVNETGGASAAATAGKTATNVAPSATTLDYNAFLRLLMAQMQNQDPTNPTDSTQWVSQLATFSSVEQAIQTNAKLDRLLTGEALSGASALVGKTISTADGTSSGRVASVTVSSAGAAATLVDGSTVDLSAGATVIADE